MGSFGVLCKISHAKLFKKATPPTVFIQFQENFMKSMIIYYC